MKIWVDADACPVVIKEILFKAAAIMSHDATLMRPTGFEHNFGHGKQHLASVLATLIMLAFLFHTILEYFDQCYRLLREHLSSQKMFFDDIRALTRYLCFESWQHLMEFMLTQLEIPLPESI